MNQPPKDQVTPRLQLPAIPSLRPKAANEIDNAVLITSSPNIGISSYGSSSSSALRRRRNGELLRYGETMDSFFAIQSVKDAEQYRSLCQNVVDNPENAIAWSLLFDHAEEKNLSKTDLIRLYRRATSRLSGSNDENLVSIWLRYAACLRESGYEKDAALTLKHMATSFPDQVQRLANFYLLQAQLLTNPHEQRKILQTGIQNNAHPKTDIQRALQQLDETTLKRGTINEVNHTVSKRCKTEEDDNSNMDTSLEGSLDISEGQPDEANQTTETKGSIRFQLAPLRKTSVSLAPSNTSNHMHSQSNIVTEMKHFDSKLECSVNEGQTTKDSSTENKDHVANATGRSILQKENSSNSSAPKIDTKSFKIPEYRETNANLEVVRKVDQEVSKTPCKSGPFHPTSTTQKLLSVNHRTASKRPPLRRLGIQGKPARVDPTANQVAVDDSDDDRDHADAKENDTITNGTMKTPGKVVVPKMDLSYMWAWDPEKRNHNSTTPATKTTSSLKASSNKSREPNLGKIDETPSLSLSETSNATACRSHVSKDGESNKINGSHNESSDENIQCSNQIEGQLNKNQESTGRASSQKKNESDSENNVSSRINSDFLPLVTEENMIRVNNIPYAKLGVIGKGGSCKVYRVLSQDGNVIAIKRVKLERLDKKQIDGYANEINLLKKLRGNPAIIQMIDSEVDLQRMAIFMVMEAGEADLNHVLQKQATISETSGERRLNMNFIRLTWYQMLVAVNAIHEEKIIHGDLKPANFLFVRGGLKLIDFGIAKAIQSDDTTNIYRESQIGTLNYMSPESIIDSGTCKHGQRMKCGRPSDIWSLGCILYQMVYGRTPFAELHFFQKLQAITDPNYEIQFPGNVDEAALDAIKQCLRRKPAERPPIVGKNGLLNEHPFLNARKVC